MVRAARPWPAAPHRPAGRGPWSLRRRAPGPPTPSPLPSPQGEAGESWVLLLLQPRRVARSPPALVAPPPRSCSSPAARPARRPAAGRRPALIAGPPRGQVAELVAVTLERTRRG